jgi:hypothetical protein
MAEEAPAGRYLEMPARRADKDTSRSEPVVVACRPHSQPATRSEERREQIRHRGGAMLDDDNRGGEIGGQCGKYDPQGVQTTRRGRNNDDPHG